MGQDALPITQSTVSKHRRTNGSMQCHWHKNGDSLGQGLGCTYQDCTFTGHRINFGQMLLLMDI